VQQQNRKAKCWSWHGPGHYWCFSSVGEGEPSSLLLDGLFMENKRGEIRWGKIFLGPQLFWMLACVAKTSYFSHCMLCLSVFLSFFPIKEDIKKKMIKMLLMIVKLAMKSCLKLVEF
jgi:hypothetical protein